MLNRILYNGGEFIWQYFLIWQSWHESASVCVQAVQLQSGFLVALGALYLKKWTLLKPDKVNMLVFLIKNL